MNDSTYLHEVLRLQTLDAAGDELKTLRKHRADVQAYLEEHFARSSPTIRYGGSYAKGTMIAEAYDLDIICYFPHNDVTAGESLEEIYNNAAKALELTYIVERKPSALRLKDCAPEQFKLDFHIDVVPGRYIDDAKSDTFLYQSSGEKRRLKTNLDVHLSHVKDSGVVDAIRLVKLWRERNGLKFKTFALELLVIKLLEGKQSGSLAHQLQRVWTEMRDHTDSLSAEDPANPAGNDLSELYNDSIRTNLASVAAFTLRRFQDNGWEAVFGPVEERSVQEQVHLLRQAAASVRAPTRPWSPGA